MTHSNNPGGDFDLEREQALVGRLKRRDGEAWKQFVTAYQPRLQVAIFCSLRQKGLPRDRMDDIEQKTWLTVYQKIDNFEPQGVGSLHRWLVKIQYLHICNLFREPAPVHIEESQVESEGEIPAHLHTPQSPNPESEFIKKENRREIWLALEMALQTLSHREREIVTQRLVLKVDVEVLAEQYGVKVQTIYQMTANCKKKMRNYLLASDLFLRANSDRTGKESRKWQK